MLKQFYDFQKPSAGVPPLYFWSLVLIAVSLPTSPFMTTVGTVIATIGWFVEGSVRQKLKRLNHHSVWFFVLLFVIHVLWMANTDDIPYGLHHLKIKLPLLLLPLVIASSPQLGFREIRTITLYSTGALYFNLLVSLSIYFGWWDRPFDDIRQISIYISHIRLVLLLNLSIFSLLFFLFFHLQRLSTLERVLFVIIIISFLFYLYLLRSLTGLFLVGLLSVLFLGFYFYQQKNRQNFRLALLFISLIILVSISYTAYQIKIFYDVEKIDWEHLPQKTAKGNNYYHELNDKTLENGHYIGLYYAENEVREAWNEVSDFPFDSINSKGSELKYALQRYLTSKGLRKDYDGVKQLNPVDITAIENGIANHRFLYPYLPDVILYGIIWQIDVYTKTGNPSGYSISQRLEYVKTTWKIIAQNFWLGVGTGDIKQCFISQYEKQNTQLSIEFRNRAHNQFLTFFVSLGIIGFFISIVALFLPIYLRRKKLSYYFVLFAIIAFLSMLNEDTLETQAGVVFFAFYYPLFLFGDGS